MKKWYTGWVGLYRASIRIYFNSLDIFDKIKTLFIYVVAWLVDIIRVASARSKASHYEREENLEQYDWYFVFRWEILATTGKTVRG